MSAAGLVPALRLAESAGFHDLLGGLPVPAASAGAKAASVVGGMLAGADSIDDLDLLRHGGMVRLFGGVRAPSTLGTFLRSFTHGHVQQLDKIGAGLLARADSAYYGHAFAGTALRHRTWFSVTARMTATVTAAITSIPTHAWQPIEYPNAVFDEDEHRWVSDAEVTEVDFIAFTGRRKAEHVACRLVVRRVKRLQPLASGGSEQGELLATYRHHAFITNSTLSTIEADQRHRDHALVEQVIAELKDGPLAHLPSGRYTANAAWVALAVIAFNIARATAVAAAMRTARWATVRTRIINVPARIATTGRRLVLHPPTHWAWSGGWELLWSTATSPPLTVTP